MNFKVVMLTVAGVCGLGAFYGTTRLLQREKPKVIVQKVVVASRDLKVEEILKPDLLKVVEMEKSNVPLGAVASPVDLEGRWVQLPVLEGEPLIERKLAPKGSPPGMISRIPKGMRAYAVDVTEQTGVSGFVLPDHRVDVVHCLRKPNGQSEAVPILQDVLVLASGTTFMRPDDRSIQSRTVTLAVTPEQVDVLVAARDTGALALALRGLNDHEKAEHKPKPVPAEEKPAAVVALKVAEPAPLPPPPPPPPPAPAPKPARYLTIYRGGGGDPSRHRLDAPEAGDSFDPVPVVGAGVAAEPVSPKVRKVEPPELPESSGPNQ